MLELSARTYAAELRRFRMEGDVWLSRNDVPTDADVPEAWLALLDAPDAMLSESFLALWSGTIERLPAVARFFAENLRRPALLRQEHGRTALLYPYTVEQDDLNFFIGQAPLGDRAPVNDASWPSLPRELRHFHRHVHDGWTFFPAHSIGPLPFGEQSPLADKLDLPPRIAGSPLERVRTILHNGAGDYLCLDPEARGDIGRLWWHEDPARLETIDVWAAMDAWIGVFLEEADRR